MDTRPVFFDGSGKNSWVRVEQVEFEWHPGMSLGQKQRSIAFMQGEDAFYSQRVKPGLGL